MNKNISRVITIAIIIVSGGAIYLLNEYLHGRIPNNANRTLKSILDSSSGVTSNSGSAPLKAFQFIKPFNEIEPQKDPISFDHLKTKLTLFIEKLKKSGKIINASVSVDYLGRGSSMDLNPEEKYTPGSMFKVINLLYFLKLDEQYPGILEKTIYNHIPTKSVETQTFDSKQIEEYKVYSIKELLKYMIAYSDNRATYLLKLNIDYKVYDKMVKDLKIPMPQSENDFMFMTASQYSEIFKIIYNSSYLSYEKSEFALNLLNQCDFKMGLLNGLPNGVTVAHKFGEAENRGLHQFHECGLVYLNKGPYLITIMTKGYRVKDLPQVLSALSKMVYNDLSKIE